MDSSFLEDLQASGAALFTHQNRLLKLRFGSGSGIGADTLLPHVLKGSEGLSSGYRYELDCLSADGFLELKDLLGQAIEIGLLLPEGGERLFTGLVTRAEHRGSDGGFSVYRLVIEPALSTLGLRQNSRVFQDKNVIEIVAAILDEHLAANPVLAASFHYLNRTTKAYPPRSYCLQYRESDQAFIERLLAEEGINYRHTHGPDPETSIRSESGASSDESTDTPLHTLILFDADTPAVQGSDTPLRFHRTDGIETADAIDTWHGQRQLQSGASTLKSYDYQSVATHSGEEASQTRHGTAGQDLALSLEDYDPQGPYYGTPEDMARYATLRQQARDLAQKAFTGEGTVRHLLPGTWFALTDHPLHDQDNPEDREFRVTRLDFEARNNLTPEAQNRLAGLLTRSETSQNQPPYRNTFQVVRRHLPLVPVYQQSQHQKPRAWGMTTATVVGPEGEEIHTDEHGRIKLQFHWQRPSDHPEGGADQDERSSTWVRVAMPSAGAQWGSQYIPRIGQEVVIDFLEGDIDRPVVTGVLYNGSHRPPTFSGAGQLPANKILSGVKTKEYKGSRYNELVFDDSTNEIRTKLSSEHGKTQLNQGYLIHPRTNGKGEPRGEGFELRTDEAGAVRAQKGLLLTTEAKPNASGKQLDRSEAKQQLEAALELSNNLGEVAEKQLANRTETGKDQQSLKDAATVDSKKTTGHQTHLKEAIESLEKGTNTDKDSKSGSKHQGGQQPVLLTHATAGIALTTPQSTTIATGTNLDQVAQRDTNQTTGRRWIHNAGESIALFVAGSKAKIKETIKIIAANGKVQLQAQHGEVEITGDKSLHITSTQNRVFAHAKEHITLTCGGGYIRIANGNIEAHCSGLLEMKAGSYTITGPTSIWPPFPEFPVSGPAKHSLRWKAISAVDGRPAQAIDVISMSHDNKIIQTEKTGKDGRSTREFLPDASEERTALIGSGEWVVDMESDIDPVQLEYIEDDELPENEPQ